MTASSRKVVLDGVIERITTNYVFEEKASALAKALRRKGASREFAAITDPEAFATAINAVIRAEANDAHLRLIWSPEPLPPMAGPERPDPALLARELALFARNNYEIPKAEVLGGNIGYLKMNMFAPAQFGGPTLTAAMAFLQHTDAMIVDLRDNGGGDPGMVALAVSYFVPPDTKINGFRRRGQAQVDQIWTLPYVPGGRWSIDKPVYVLTSKRTGSGAEEFAYDLQQLKRATIVGEPTWGGANPGDIFPIDQHFAIFVPTGAAVNPISKTSWEGKGVQPDVAVNPVTALESARRIALEKLIATASPDRAAELRSLINGGPAR
ncbi:S41 family peptidase [Sphingomonas sp. LHG3406-1]|uniref:S41 family peptidase n=1 Tax=Sphingomonas sp. LHG3406-1 TaxID=2804617 RepID=UPI00262944F3|nr:S41 family peptidase [Sphingomonas sp. LHG3406-1]